MTKITKESLLENGYVKDPDLSFVGYSKRILNYQNLECSISENNEISVYIDIECDCRGTKILFPNIETIEQLKDVYNILLGTYKPITT
jgi:hypothetical protein